MTKEADKIQLQLYEPRMKEQIAELFELEYKISGTEFSKFMSRLYEHPFQNNKCIKIVALDDKKVVGFQSFFYWPYTHNNRVFNSYQSGNSLVHPDYRGRRLFARMLNYIYENEIGKEIDFLMGFPVQASYNSFIKNGWQNLFNLQWYIKPVNPFGFLFPVKKLQSVFEPINTHNAQVNTDCIQLIEDTDFWKWKSQLVYANQNYFQFTYSNNNKLIVIDLKLQKRKKIINEIIIGNIRFNREASVVLEEAIQLLLKRIKQAMCVTMVSWAVNENFNKAGLQSLLTKHRFKKIDNKIYFIVKPLRETDVVLNAALWNIGRADIDTW